MSYVEVKFLIIAQRTKSRKPKNTHVGSYIKHEIV